MVMVTVMMVMMMTNVIVIVMVILTQRAYGYAMVATKRDGYSPLRSLPAPKSQLRRWRYIAFRAVTCKQRR